MISLKKSDEIAQQHNLERDLPVETQEPVRLRNEKRQLPAYLETPNEISSRRALDPGSPAANNAPKTGQTPSPPQSAPTNGHVPYINIFNWIGVELEGYSTNQLHALAPYGPMLNMMSSEQITMLLDKTSSLTPDGRGLFASRPPPRRTSLPAQKQFIVTPGGDRVYT